MAFFLLSENGSDVFIDRANKSDKDKDLIHYKFCSL